jgi:hypothetical protein
MIARIDREATAMSGIYVPALMSLKATLLARTGRRAEAVDLGTRALARARDASMFEAATRAHRLVIEERVRELNGGA